METETILGTIGVRKSAGEIVRKRIRRCVTSARKATAANPAPAARAAKTTARAVRAGRRNGAHDRDKRAAVISHRTRGGPPA